MFEDFFTVCGGWKKLHSLQHKNKLKFFPFAPPTLQLSNGWANKTVTRKLSSMIHSARTTVSPVMNIVFTWNLLCFEKWGRTEGHTCAYVPVREYMCENNDHYWLWVVRVDQQKCFFNLRKPFMRWEIEFVRSVISHQDSCSRFKFTFAVSSKWQTYLFSLA